MSAQAAVPTKLPVISGYQLLKKLGQGGMGAVFMAKQLSMDRIVAVKILPAQLARNQAFVERFIREAKMAGRLSHENVVNAIDAGVENGTYYLAMEFVEGSSVRDLLTKEKTLAEAEALRIVRQAANGLKCAHDNGMIHRDVKPDNLLLDKEGTVKLADLGLARASKEDSSLTQTGTALGTPQYIAPEQARGDKDIDHRADIYSLGAMLYHLVTGEPPFKGETAAVVMAKHIMDEQQHPRDRNPNAKLSDGCCALIGWMMQKDPAARPANAQEVLDGVDRVANGQLPWSTPRSGVASNKRRTGQHAPVGAIPGARRGTEGPLKVVGPRMRDDSTFATRVPGPRPPQSNPAVLMGVGGAVALLVLGMVLGMGSGKQEPRAAAASRNAEKTSERAPEPAKPEVRAPEPAKPVEPARPAEAPMRPAQPAVPLPADKMPGQAEFEAATAYARANPDDHQGILRRIEPIAEKYAGTPVGGLANLAIGATKLKIMKQEADARAAQTAQAGAVAVKNDPVPSPAVVEPAAPAPAPAADASLAAARAEYGKQYEEVAQALKTRDWTNAAKKLDAAAREAKFKPIAGVIAEDRADVKRIEALLAQAEKNIDMRKGEPVALDARMQGKIAGIERGRVNIDLGKGATSVSFRDKFPPDEIVKTFDKQPGMDTAEAARARAAFWIAMQETDPAEAALKDLPEDAKGRYAQAVEAIKKGREAVLRAQTESEAEALAKKIEDLDKQNRAKDALALLDDFSKRYKETQVAAARASYFEQVRDKAAGRATAEMVRVDGGAFKFGPRREERKLPAYFIDKYEVSNKEFRKFAKWMLAEQNRQDAAKLVAEIAERHNGPRDMLEYMPRYLPEVAELVEARMQKEHGHGDRGGEHGDRMRRTLDYMREMRERMGGDDQPVVDINWYGAAAYAQWAGKRLPTAEEWDKAARGTDGRNMPAGNWSPKDAEKYNGGNEYEFRDEYKGAAPVNSMAEGASPYGCHHMSGNVWEWISEPGQCRGGSYMRCQGHLSLDCEDNETRPTPWARNMHTGFRCVKSER